MRGSFTLDLLFFLVFIFAFATTLVVAGFVLNTTEDSMTWSGSTNVSVADPYLQNTHNALGAFDNFAVFLIIGCSLGVIASSVLIKTHPIYFIGALVVQLFIVVIATILSNSWYSFVTGAGFVDAAGDFPTWVTIMGFFPQIALVVSVLMALAIYAKTGTEYG